MNRIPLTAGVLVAGLAALLVPILRNHSTEHAGPAIQTREVASAGNQQSENGDGLVVAENQDPSEEELRELQELFEPSGGERKRTEVVQLGESVLADILFFDDGRVAYTFVTPQGMIAESGETLLMFKSRTSTLRPDGGLGMLSYPSVATKEGQPAKISVSRNDGTVHSLQFSGILTGGDSVALSVEMTVDPAVNQPWR